LKWPNEEVLRVRGTLAWLFVTAAVSAACTSTTVSPVPSVTPRNSTSRSVAIPSGWKTYTFGKAAIAVPSDWAVATGYSCPEPKKPGTLFLGPSRNPDATCPMYSVSVDSVTIAPSPLRPGDACTRSVQVNGLVVDVVPCATAGVGITYWTVPSLGVQIAATQADGTIVGTKSSSLDGQVLHTLHKA